MHVRTAVTALLALLAILAAGCGATADAGGAGGGGAGTGDEGGTADMTSAPAPPAEPPYIRGRISSVTPVTPVTENCSPADPDGDGAVSSDDPPVCNPNPDVWGSFVIAGTVANQGGKTEASTTVGKGTPIIRKARGGLLEPATFDELRGAEGVSVWITGQVAESYPVQVTATYVLLSD